MKKALICIDYTVDFVADEGKLTAGYPAQAIETALVRAVESAYEQGDYIFFAVDGHDKNDHFHPENKLFPPHNIIGTRGRTLYGQLNNVYQRIRTSDQVFWLDKRYYSAFSGTDLDVRLRERGVKVIVLIGVLTDICVLHTAISAYHLGYAIEVIEAAVASLETSRNQFALNHLQDVLGAKLI